MLSIGEGGYMISKKNRSIFRAGFFGFFLFAALITAASAQAKGEPASVAGGIPSWSISLNPEFVLPLGSDASYIGLGGGGGVSGTMRLSSFPLLYLGAGLDYSFLSTKAPGTSLSIVDLGAQTGMHFQLSRSLSLRIGGEGGYFMGALSGGSSPPGYNPYFMGGARVGLDLSPGLELSLGAAYRDRIALSSELVAGLGLSLSLGMGSGSTSLPKDYLPLKSSGRGLGFVGSRLDTVFPVFFKHYDDHTIGSILIRNYEGVSAKDIRATVEVKRYMDEPKSAEVVSVLEPGATAELKLYGLFTEKILEIVEATKLPVSVKLSYSQYGKAYQEEYVGTLSVLDRNAITWDDDRKAAAFISSKDPSVLVFAKSVASSVRDLLSPGINGNLQAVMAVHEALRIQGLTYVKDPSSALETNNKQVVDFILFPQQTFAFNSGKCGDLTVLYSSLLESIGVPTALITTPGHIFMAADLEMAGDQAVSTFSRPEDLIMKDGTAWLPLETTMRKEGFAQAWEEAAREWREATANGTAAFYPVHEAWKAYQPVVLSGGAAPTGQKDPKAGSEAFKRELASFISSETGPRVAVIQAEIKKKGGNASLYNKLGVLFARYGLLDKAADQFKAALGTKSAVGSATYNMGNILFLQGKYSDALSYYAKALVALPGDAKTLLAVARVDSALGKYDAALASYDKLKAADPALASRYAYLGGGADSGKRAADAEKTKGDLLWQD
jgi:TolA-binding protein